MQLALEFRRSTRPQELVRRWLRAKSREFGDRTYLLEHALPGDYAFVRAQKADTHGNLQYVGTSRAFGPAMAAAAKITIAEVDEIVEPGGIDAERVGTLGAYVDRIVQREPGDPYP